MGHCSTHRPRRHVLGGCDPGTCTQGCDGPDPRSRAVGRPPTETNPLV